MESSNLLPVGANGRLWVLLDAKPVNAGSGVADA